MREEFWYLSRNGVTKIHAVEWKPVGGVKAVLQICHGMVEYIGRYDEFASYLAEHGCYVVGHDHLGHGFSVQSEKDYGFFHEKEGNRYVIGDIHKLREITMEKYPKVPYYMLGHSMGSFLLRQYLAMYGEGLAGAIVMGTGYKGPAVLAAGKALCRLIAIFKGWRYRSELVNSFGLGSFNKKFEPSESKREWVTSDEKLRLEYEKDPLCNFTFTVNGYYQMFKGMQTLNRRENMNRIPRSLPIFFVAGADDPVGDFGEGVKKVYHKYKESGMKDVKIKLYPKFRHEILNENGRETVYEDLYHWMESKRS